MEHLTSSILYAIQEIPGERREEKFKEIGRLVRECIEKQKLSSDSINSALNIPKPLVPLIRVLVGNKLKIDHFIIEALKCNDIYIVQQALKAKWFYNGSIRSVTSFQNFITNILPYISAFTRRKIVKKLSVNLSDVNLAEEFFNGFVYNYGVQEATPLLVACSEDFIYTNVIKYKISLSNGLLTDIYKKYPDIVIKYLKLADPSNKSDPISRRMYGIVEIHEYEAFIPLLITKHPEVFVDIQEIFHYASPTLGNKRALMLIRKAKHLIINRPKDIIRLMPFKLVCDKLTNEEFETMFGNMFPDLWDCFDLKEMLEYLEYYPKEKRANLLMNKFEEVYGHKFFDKIKTVTPNFLLLLPKEERYAQTLRIINKEDIKIETDDIETSALCYLPVKQAIAAIKLNISKEWKSENRKKLLYHLVYVCKLNEDLEALLDVLQYLNEVHGTDRSDVICHSLDYISQEFDLNSFDSNHWNALYKVIKKVNLGKQQARDYWVLIKLLKKHIHYNDDHGLPVDDIVELVIKLFLDGRVGVSWKLLEDHPKFERKYLLICLNNPYWLNIDYKKNIVEGIYSFNERHVKPDTCIEKLSIRDFPELMKLIKETITKEQKEVCFWINYTKEKLRKHEPELFKEWFPDDDGSNSASTLDYNVEYGFNSEVATKTESNGKKLYMTEAIIALKENFKVILNDWLGYYNCCINDLSRKKRKRVKTFLKALKWYQEIPILFARKALAEENFGILGYLVDGFTFANIVKPFLAKDKVSEELNLSLQLDTIQIINVIRNVGLLVPAELVEIYFKHSEMYSYRNYINDGLKFWSYIAYRMPLNSTLVLAKNLAKDRSFMKKHAIRLICSNSSTKDQVEFYKDLWKTEKHPFIRGMLARKIGLLFTGRPGDETWNLLNACLKDLLYHELNIFEELLASGDIPVNYASDFISQILIVLDDFIKQGLLIKDADKALFCILKFFEPECSDFISNESYNYILENYIFRTNLPSSREMSSHAELFVLTIYLNPESKHFEERFKVFSNYLKTLLSMYSRLSYEERRKSYDYVGRFSAVILSYNVLNYKRNSKVLECLYNLLSSTCTSNESIYNSCIICLFMCVEFSHSNGSYRDFGLRISNKIDGLIEKLSSMYVIIIADMLKELFVSYFVEYDYSKSYQNRRLFLEGLIESRNENCLIIASRLVNKQFLSEFDRGYIRIIEILSSIDNPLVRSFL